jgi:hypothetical protein
MMGRQLGNTGLLLVWCCETAALWWRRVAAGPACSAVEARGGVAGQSVGLGASQNIGELLEMFDATLTLLPSAVCCLLLQASGGSSLDKKRIISTDRHIVKVTQRVQLGCCLVSWHPLLCNITRTVLACKKSRPAMLAVKVCRMKRVLRLAVHYV